MPARDSNWGVTSTRVRSALIVTLPEAIASGTLAAARSLALDAVRGQSLEFVIFDLSSVAVMDCAEFNQLRAIAEMMHLLGARTTIVGIRPGIVAYLVSNDVSIEGPAFGRELEDALDLLSGAPGASPEAPRGGST